MPPVLMDYTAKNAQPVTMLMKTSLNNILLPILFRPVFINIVTGWAASGFALSTETGEFNYQS
jgi:hypothetical protein